MSLGPDSFEEAKRAWKKQDEWRRESAHRYEQKRREEADGKYRDLGHNPERKKKRRARDFGDKADFIRDQLCDTCGAPSPNDPSHYPSRGAGGKKEDQFPQCRACHRKMSAPGWGVETLLESIGKDKAWLRGRTEHWEDEWQKHKGATDG